MPDNLWLDLIGQRRAHKVLSHRHESVGPPGISINRVYGCTSPAERDSVIGLLMR